KDTTTNKLIFSLLLFLFHCSLYSQTAQLQGYILDAENGEPLIAATIQVGSTGAVTDVDGRFQLELSEGKHLLVVSYIGYSEQRQNINLKTGEVKNIELQLAAEANILETATVTSGKYEKPLGEVTVSMDILKPKLIEATNATSIDQTLQKIPGVSFVGGQANIRGGSGWSYGAGSRVLLLIDNIPALQADAGLPNWGDVPLENAEQVEIIKGAASALYGSSALNGIINVRTGYAKAEPETRISTFVEMWDTPSDASKKWWDKAPYQVGLSFQHKQKFNKLDLVTSGFGITRNGGVVKNSFNRNARLTVSTRYRFSDRLTAGFNSNFNRGSGRSYFYWSGNGPNAYIGDPSTESNSDRFRYTIDPYVNFLAKNGWRHRVQGRFYNVQNNVSGNQSNGSQLYYGEYQTQKRMDQIGLVATAGIVASRTNVTAELYGDTSYHSDNAAAYLQLEKKFFGRLNITSGLRYERNKISGPTTILVGRELVEIDEAEQVESKPVLRLGANFQATKATFIRASWGQGYRFPTIAEKFISTVSGAALILPSPGLTSETGWSAEVGIKQGFKISNWTGYVDASVFWTEYDNMMEFRLTQVFPQPAFQSLNVGGTRIKGYEVSIAGQGSVGQVDLSVLGGYTYLDPKFQEFTEDELYSSSVDYNILKYRSKHSAKLDVQAEYRRWSLGV
ncbi:MAG: TonB-dependent receptor, partial [Bacteroidota bacterium]